MTYAFLKGHGTQNDFVLLPDHDGTVHGALSADRVRALCDRRAGIGGDGVLRVIRTAAHPEVSDLASQAEWFMDYRNSDGSVSQMCGNGVRVFARHLIESGLVTADAPIPVATRAGIKTVTVVGEDLMVDMGRASVLGESVVSVGAMSWPARHIDMGNPHAVAFVDSLDAHGPVGSLVDEPGYDRGVYPHGVNIEFVQRLGAGHVAMRVHERGSGETRSCGTGACAVAVAVALADGVEPGAATSYRVDLPGGSLTIAWTADGTVLMTGPAELVAEGVTDL